MTVQTYTSTQLDGETRKRPLDDHGKIRLCYFEVTADDAGDATSTFDLCRLPPGAVRILPALSRYNCDALGAARTLDFGHRAYLKRPGTEEAEDLDAFAADIDAENAIAGAALGTATKFDVYSLDGVVVTAQVNDAAVASGKSISGFIAYAYE